MAYLSAGLSRKRYFFERFCSLFPKRRIPTEGQNTSNFQTGKQTAKPCSLQGRLVIGALFRLPEGELLFYTLIWATKIHSFFQRLSDIGITIIL